MRLISDCGVGDGGKGNNSNDTMLLHNITQVPKHYDIVFP